MKPLVSVFIALTLAGLAGVANAQVTQTYSYDANGRLTGVSTTGSGGTNTAAYVYDDADNRTSRSQTGTSTWAALSRLPVGQSLHLIKRWSRPTAGSVSRFGNLRRLNSGPRTRSFGRV